VHFVEESAMKKLQVLFVVVLSCLLAQVVACGDDDKKPGPQIETDQEVTDVESEGFIPELVGPEVKELETADEQDQDEFVGPEDEDLIPQDEELYLPPSLEFCVSTEQGCLDEAKLDLTMADDQNPDEVGLQVNFTVTVDNIDMGEPVEVRIDGMLVTTQNIPSQQFDISNITLSHKPAPDCHVVELKVPGVTFAQKSVCVETGQCGITLAPKNDVCLAADFDLGTPGMQAQFTITNDGTDCDEAWIVYGGGEFPAGHASFDEEGVAEIIVKLSDMTELECYTVEFDAHVGDSNNPDREAKLSYENSADTTIPAVVFTAPTELTVNLLDDADPVAEDLQLEVSAIVSGTAGGGTVEFLVDSKLIKTVPSLDGEFEFIATFTQAGGHAVEVRATDCCGSEGSATLDLLVIFSQNDVLISAPQMGAKLLSKNDKVKDGELTYDTDFTVFSPSSNVADDIIVECRKNIPGSYFVATGQLTLTAVTPDWLYVVPVVLDVDALGNEVLCHAVAGGGVAKYSPDVALTVGLPAPALTIEEPAEGAMLEQADFSVSGIAANLDGQEVLIALAGPVGGQLKTAAVSGGYSYQGKLDGYPDGEYTVAVDATDQFGNKVSEQVGAPAPVGFILDSAPPVVSFVAPIDGQACTVDTCPDAIEDDVLAGHQIEVLVAVDGEPSPETTVVCLTVNGGPPLPCVTPSGEGGQYVAHFYAVTVVSGGNLLAAYGTDGLGHQSDLATAMVSLTLDAPRVLFVAPAFDLVTATQPIQVIASVTSPDGATPLADAEVTVLVGGNNGPSSSVGPGGQYEFAVSGLVANSPVSLQLKAKHAGYAKEAFSDTRSATLKESTPSITITSPTDGAIFNKASFACAAGIPGCQIKVSASVENVENKQKASLLVTCNGADLPALPEADVTGGAVTWPKVTLPDNSTCTLTASVKDVIGQEAASTPVSVTVDRTPPVIKKFVAPTTALVGVGYDADPNKDLFQFTVSVHVSGVPAGQNVTLNIAPKSGQPSQISTPVASDIPDAQTTTVAFPQFDFPFEEVTLTASVSDLAGNSSSLKGTFRFFQDPVTVGFYAGEYVEFKACNSSAECGLGACVPLPEGSRCVVPWKSASQIVKVSNKPEQFFSGKKNLRICTDHVEVTGEECAYTGQGTFHVLKTTDHVGGYDTVSFPKVEVDALPQGRHRLMVEALRTDTGKWMSSLESAEVKTQERILWVDTQSPTIDMLSFPDDAQPGDGWLNGLEAVQGLPEKNVFKIQADVTGAPLGTCTIYLNDVAKLFHPLAAQDAQSVSAQLWLPQGKPKVCAEVVDLVGNKSGQTCKQPNVDTEPPSLKFISPNNTPSLLVGSSADVTMGTDPSLDVKLDIVHDGQNSSVSKKANAQGNVVFDKVLSADGQYELKGSTKDAAGNPKPAVTNPAVILVDRSGPTCSITAPASGSVLAPEDDADPQAGGFQIQVAFSATDTADWDIWALRCYDDAFANCDAPSLKQLSSIQDLGNGQFSAMITAANLVQPMEYRILRVTVQDANGNKSSADTKISIELGDCAIAFVNLPEGGFVNNETHCPVPGTDCAVASLDPQVAVIGACGDAAQLAFFVDDFPAGASSDLLNGLVTFPLDLADGDTVVIKAELQGGDVPASTGEFSITSDLLDPVATIVSPTGAPFLCNVEVDLNDGLDGCQVAVQVQVVDMGAAGGKASLLRTSGGQEFPLVETQMNASPFANTFPSVTIPEGTGQGLLLRATDLAGNKAETSVQVTSDVTRPGTNVLQQLNPLTDVNRRRPAVTLSWTAVADDGTQGAPADHYDIRYSTSPIDSKDAYDHACELDDLAGTGQPPVPGAPNSPETFQVSGPDVRPPTDPCRFIVNTIPGSKYYFAVRAVDDAGNKSEFNAQGVQSTDAISLRYSRFISSGLGASALGSVVFDLGDINGDTMAEIALGGDAAYGGFCIVRGHANPAQTIDLAAPGNPNVKCIKDNTVLLLGATRIVGLGDVNGDGFGDIGVAARHTVSPKANRFRVYLGNSDGFVADSPAVTFILGDKWYSMAHIESAGNFNGDATGSGKPLNDVLVAVPNLNRVFVVPGKTAWGGGAVTIDLLLDADITVWSVVKIQGVGLEDNVDFFGQRSKGVGNVILDGDGSGKQYDDVAIGKKENGAAMYLVKGRPTPGTMALSVSKNLDGTGTEDTNAVKVKPEPEALGVPDFAMELFGGHDIDGDGTMDVGVVHASTLFLASSYLLVIYGPAINASIGKTLQVGANKPAGSGAFMSENGLKFSGTYASFRIAGNFDDMQSDGGQSLDLVFGDYQSAETGHVYVRLNQQDYAEDGKLFPYPDLVITDPNNESSKTFGGLNVVPVGDFNNDDLPDVLAADKGTMQPVLIH